MAILEYLHASNQKQQLVVDRSTPRITIGRNPEADIPTSDSSVSRNHAEIVIRAGLLLLRDLDSSNGTTLNEQELRPHKWMVLQTKDVVRFGEFEVRVVDDTLPPDVEQPAVVAGRPLFPAPSGDQDRIRWHSPEAGALFQQELLLGRSFAFVARDVLRRPSLDWLGPLLGVELASAPRIISLLGPQPAQLPGCTVQPLLREELSLAVVTADRELYRAGEEVVHLLVCDPLAPGQELVCQVRLEGVDLCRCPVRLGPQGAGLLRLRELPAGEYEVRLDGTPATDPLCRFTVAEYRLAPLLARLLEQRLSGDELTVRLALTTFGLPVVGEVQLELHSQGTRLAQLRTTAREGVAEAVFRLSGAGPHAVNLQLVRDPSRTATVALRGSRETERLATVVCPLGEQTVASLLPGPEPAKDRAVRGLFLRPGVPQPTPILLEEVITRRAVLCAPQGADLLRVVVLEPAPATTGATSASRAVPLVVRRELETRLAAGGRCEVELDGPVALLVLGAWIGHEPWEGWTAVLTPSRIVPRIEAPAHARPREEIRLQIRTDGGDAEVFLVVRDARLQRGDTPESRLAGQLKTFLELTRQDLGLGQPRTTLSSLALQQAAHAACLPPPARFKRSPPAPEPDAAYQAASPRSRPRSPTQAQAVPAPVGPPHVSPALAPSTVPPPATEAHPPVLADPEEQPAILFADLLSTQAGQATVRVQLGEEPTDYVAEAFALAGSDWAAAEARFSAVPGVFATFDLPTALEADGRVWARLRFGTHSGQARVRVECDGEELPLWLAPPSPGAAESPLPADAELTAHLGSVSFVARPGRFVAHLDDLGTHEQAAARQSVERLGRQTRLVRSIRLLHPGQEVARDADPSLLRLRLLPGVDQSWRRLAAATAEYPYGCCEQTAARVLAAGSLLLAVGPQPPEGRQAIEVIQAGVRRLRSMFLPGRGFKMYPERPDEPDHYWGPQAARHLRFLQLLDSPQPASAVAPPTAPPELRQALAEARAMAEDAFTAYGQPWPPATLRSAEDAYLSLRFASVEDESRPTRALQLARAVAAHQAAGSPPTPTTGDQARGRVARRTTSAYAAAALLRGGRAGDRETAIRLANEVLCDLNAEGRLYSTVDSVAALALLAELQAAGLSEQPSRVQVDGQELSGAELAGRTPEVRLVRVLEGVVLVEELRTVAEDWAELSGRVPLEVTLGLAQDEPDAARAAALARAAVGAPCRLVAGAPVALTVRLPAGYQPGDLLQLDLPPALSRVVGGGQVRRFTVDCAGRNQVTVPLAATAATLDPDGRLVPQRLAVCLRNMFEEERVGYPGPIPVLVLPVPAD